MLLSQLKKRMCDDMNPINILVTGICNMYVVFGEMRLMLPVDLIADLLLFLTLKIPRTSKPPSHVHIFLTIRKSNERGQDET